MANDKVYIHEFIDIIGHNRANYMHHMTANFADRPGRAQPALLRRVGHGRHHPAVARGREHLGGGRLRRPGQLVPPRVQPRRACRTRRSPPGGPRPRSSAGRGIDRVLVPAAVDRHHRGAVRRRACTGETYAHELITVPAGTAWDVLDARAREGRARPRDVRLDARRRVGDGDVQRLRGARCCGPSPAGSSGPSSRRPQRTDAAMRPLARRSSRRGRRSGTASCSSTRRSRRSAPGASRSRATATPSSCRTDGR